MPSGQILLERRKLRKVKRKSGKTVDKPDFIWYII
ncbi:hypothetical protein BACCAP_00318 [Pseudoflavonifractor capillosus ATCC 29799]|uniref:Uncharacterized protein n=1 Tax=Pseudoflavonifractor capillosus ATCC 29799 TaxID=411467 RepID=A6NQ48_9FIRM|nr:hypothetical protein BACCAP_00318 [Pseudoflavonifractor capillosus ATCC 29799]